MKIIKFRHSIEPRDRIYIRGYGFLSFAKNMSKTFINKYGQKLHSTKKATTDAIKTASKRVIQKTAEATGDLNGNKVINKITIVSKKSPKELQNNETEANKASPNDAPKTRYISPDESQQIIDELRLVKKYNNGISRIGKFVRQRSIKSTIYI